MNDSSLFSSSKSDAKKNGEFFKRASWIGEPSLRGLKGVGGSFDFLMVIIIGMREDIKIFKDKVLGNAR